MAKTEWKILSFLATVVCYDQVYGLNLSCKFCLFHSQDVYLPPSLLCPEVLNFLLDKVSLA